jgi:hypothetical protein
MVGDAIETILANIDANLFGLHVPNRRGNQWVIHTMIDRQPNDTKDAASDFDKYIYQLDSYARTESEMDTLAESVKSAMDRYSGTVSGTVIDHIFFASESDTVEFVEDEGSKENYYRRIQEYEIWVKL